MTAQATIPVKTFLLDLGDEFTVDIQPRCRFKVTGVSESAVPNNRVYLCRDLNENAPEGRETVHAFSDINFTGPRGHKIEILKRGA